MKFIKPVGISAVVAIMAVTTVFSGVTHARTIAGRVPPDPMVYIGWNGPPSRWAGYPHSRFKDFLDHSRLSELFTRDLPEILRMVEPKHPHTARILAESLINVNLFFQHPFALYISRFSLPNAAAAQPATPSHIELIMRAGKSRALAMALFKKIADAFNHLAGGAPAAYRMRVGRFGNLVYLTNGLTPSMKELLHLDVGAVPPRSFMQSVAYQQALAQTQTHPALMIYVDLQTIVRGLNFGLTLAPSTHEGGKAVVKFLEKSFHVGRLTSLVMTAGIVGRRFTRNVFIGGAGGQQSPQGQKSVERMLRLVPRTCDNFAIDSLDIKALMDLVAHAVHLTDGGAQFDQGLAMIKASTGLDVRKDVINTFGGHWLIYQSPYIPLAGNNGLVVVNTLRHPRRLAQSFVTLTPMLLVAANAEAHRVNPAAPPLRLSHVRVGKNIVYYLTASPLLVPSWCITPHHFYFALLPRAIQMAMEHKPGENSIVKSVKFQSVMRRLHAAGVADSISYCDEPAMAPAAYTEILLVEKMLPLLTGISLHPPLSALLPRLSRVRKLLTPSGTVSWSDGQGYHFRYMSAFPGSSLFAPQSVSSMNPVIVGPMTAAMATAIVRPTMAAAKKDSNKLQAELNEHKIINWCVDYAGDHQGRLPSSAGAIVSMHKKPAIWIAPGSGTMPLTVDQINNTSAAKLNTLLAQHSDFVYAGDGVALNSILDPVHFILVYEPHPPAGLICAVGFADGHVSTMTEPALRSRIRQNNAVRRKMHLPVLQP